MITCNRVTRDFHAPNSTITLDETARHRRRMVMTCDNGTAFLLDLPDARLLRHGDGLELSDGRVIEVHAMPESLHEVTGSNAQHLLALAWQIGNRHLAAQIEDARILIRRDHVIREMLEGLGATLREIEAPFDPQGGAYGGSHQSHHAHDHTHGAEHNQHHHD
ncbi:MAG: urease accessory protein UreE [Rhizobiaceae bacterium]